MSRKILLADDSLTIQKVVELTFLEGDYEVTAASNGDDALAKLREFDPDVVIADVHMPGADGYEICRASKKNRSEVPVVLLVGTFEPFEESAASDAGANAYLKKPFDSQELMRLVESLLPDGSGTDTQSEDPSFSKLDEVSSSEVDISEIETIEELPEAISLTEASESEVIETFGETQTIDAVDQAVVETNFMTTDSEPAHQATALSDQDVERIAQRVAELIGDQVIREVSWDVIPDLAEIVIKDRIKELESQVD